MKAIVKGFDAVTKALFNFCCFLVLASFVAVVGDVILRFFFNYPILWAVEFSEYTLMAITFLGSAWVLKLEGHVNLDFLVDMLNEKAAAVVTAITSIIAGIACLIIVYYSGLLTIQRFKLGAIMVGKAVEIHQAPLLAILPLGILLLALQFFRRAFLSLITWRTREQATTKSETRIIEKLG